MCHTADTYVCEQQINTANENKKHKKNERNKLQLKDKFEQNWLNKRRSIATASALLLFYNFKIKYFIYTKSVPVSRALITVKQSNTRTIKAAIRAVGMYTVSVFTAIPFYNKNEKKFVSTNGTIAGDHTSVMTHRQASHRASCAHKYILRMYRW